MHSQPILCNHKPEDPGYFPVSGAHLYTVRHRVERPLARVLLVGSFASERHFSYIPWVRWARYLAGGGIECLRYDYRGVGESTGVFGDMRFEHWIDDVNSLARWLRSCSPPAPLVLHGLELGALLAAKVFEARAGDALLMWAAPASANEVLRSTLLRRIALDQAFKYGAARRPASDYFQRLEDGGLEVEGYRWSAELWRDSFRFELPSTLLTPAGRSAAARPFRNIALGKNSAPLVKGSSDAYEGVHKDFSALFSDSLAWLLAAASAQGGRP